MENWLGRIFEFCEGKENYYFTLHQNKVHERQLLKEFGMRFCWAYLGSFINHFNVGWKPKCSLVYRTVNNSRFNIKFLLNVKMSLSQLMEVFPRPD